MNVERVSWTSFKSFLSTHSTSIHYETESDAYYLETHDGPVARTCTIAFGTADCTDFETNYKAEANKPVNAELPPFGSKKLAGGKSLFRRIHGLKLDLDTSGSDQKVTFTVPYGSAKITSTEIIGASLGDRIDFKVLDTAAGTVTTVPNYMLNQFGFDVYPSEGRYEQKSEYDADLFLNLQLEITVKPVDSVARPVYFNLVLHEVV